MFLLTFSYWMLFDFDYLPNVPKSNVTLENLTTNFNNTTNTNQIDRHKISWLGYLIFAWNVAFFFETIREVI